MLPERGFALGMACFLALGTALRVPFALVKIKLPDKVDFTYTCYLAFFSIASTMGASK